MHIVISYAAPPGASIQQTLDQVQLPHLSALLRRLDPTGRITGAATDLTPLHERLLAQHTWPGVQAADGLVPWAGAEAQRRALDSGRESWAFLTLCHWNVHADHVAMDDPAQLQVTDEESRTLQDAMRPYFAEDGITLHTHTRGTWLAQGEVFRELPTASLDRVRGNKVDTWIPRQAQAKPLRRLHNEMQMLLYTHPHNDARAARGLPAINAFWVSGTGDLPERSDPPPGVQQTSMVVHDELKTSALQDHAAAWRTAWQQLDVGPIRTLLERSQRSTGTDALALTICGENAAQTYALQPRNLWSRVASHFAKPDLHTLLKTL